MRMTSPGGGGGQRAAFEMSKEYLSKPLVLQALVVGRIFRLYIVMQACAVGAILT
jgi:hypothetical protein